MQLPGGQRSLPFLLLALWQEGRPMAGGSALWQEGRLQLFLLLLQRLDCGLALLTFMSSLFFRHPALPLRPALELRPAAFSRMLHRHPHLASRPQQWLLISSPFSTPQPSLTSIVLQRRCHHKPAHQGQHMEAMTPEPKDGEEKDATRQCTTPEENEMDNRQGMDSQQGRLGGPSGRDTKPKKTVR